MAAASGPGKRPGWRARLTHDAHAQAGVAYACYGLTYLGGAVAQLSPDRMQTFFGFVPWWAFYVTGAVLVAVLPVVVWHGFRWFTLVLALGPSAKALTLAWRQGARWRAGEDLPSFDWFFALMALTAVAFMLRAVASGPRRPPASRSGAV